MVKQRLVFVSVVGAVALALVGCSSAAAPSGSGAPKAPIAIGSISTMTGTYAKPDSSGAAKAYFDQVNAAGGVNGHKINFIVVDDQKDPAQASQGARSLVDSENVVALVAGASSADCATNAAYYAQRNVLSVPGAGADQICFTSSNISPVNASPFVDVGLTLKYISGDLKKTNICLLANNASPTYVSGIQAEVSKWEKTSGHQLTYANYRLTPTDDMSVYVVQAKQAGCQAVVFATGGAQLVSAASAAKAQGVDTSAGGVPYIGILVDDSTSKAIGNQDNVLGMTGGFEPWMDTNIPAVKKYSDLMKKAGVTLGQQSEGGYSAAEVIVHALESIKGDITRDSVTKALHAINYKPGLMGSPFTFSSSSAHSSNVSAKFLRVKGGEWVAVSKEFVVLPSDRS